MADSKLFMIPFGASGDRAAIPETVAPSGTVSWPQGFGPDYERDPAMDPLAKRVPRDETNEYLYQITNAIKFLQLYGVPEWFAIDGSGASVSYPLGARVRYDAGGGMKMWRSLAASNTATPGSDFTKWTPFENGAFLGVKRFLSSGVYTPSLGASRVLVVCIGGGGGSAGSRFTSVGEVSLSAGGNSGSWGEGVYDVSPSASIPVTVGAGGAAGAAEGGVGGDGGQSSFGTLISAPGGRGSEPSTTKIPPYISGPAVAGGVASGGNIWSGAEGLGTVAVAASADSFLGGNGAPGPKGNPFGAGGLGVSTGPGAASGSPGGAGQPGAVIIYEYA